MPDAPKTFRQKHPIGRAGRDRLYNRYRAHHPHEKALHSARWQKVRLMVLQRDHYLCQHCLQQDRYTEAHQVHHKTKRRHASDLIFDLDNLISLCPSCHAKADRATT